MNLSLFSTNPGESGFRVNSFELYNWGTFDKLYKIEPHGETSLLTGANASGKTTLVDGLLTLLVPERRMRFYNQTAGAKGERTEESYVLGEYSETENAESNTREITRLRPEKEKTQSVLLAVFRNESNFLSLAQVRWFANGELKRNFVVAHKSLSIENDFSPIDNTGEWKKRLKMKYPKQGSKDILYTTDSPGEYGRMMRKIFGMRSEKAHTLFSQTIGLKVLGNLDEFVRLQMLEERDAEGEFQKIKSYFKTLNDAHRAIEKAYQQIELLLPIKEISIPLNKDKVELNLTEQHKNVAPLWFALRQKEIIEDFLISKGKEQSDLENEVRQLDDLITELGDKERDLDMQIRTDGVGKRIIELERKNKELESTKSDKAEELKRYNSLAEEIGLQVNPQKKELFEEQRKQALIQKKKALEDYDQNDIERINCTSYKKQLDTEFDNISNELSFLRTQKNNITGSPARIRNEILEYIDASEKELPFVGELIKVREDEKEWEPAIERLLHNFALRLIVPEKYYQKVNEYVNKNDLKGRIIYQKFNKKDEVSSIFKPAISNELIQKLEFKQSEFTGWIKSEVENNFEYICTEDLEEFRLCKKAVMKSGLIKNNNRHEKDDRVEIKERLQYVLGWDNKEKIYVLREQANKINIEITELEKKLTFLKNRQTRIEKEKENLIKFIEFNSYKRIDWWSVLIQVQENTNKIEELQKTNNRINTLKKQRDQILDEIKETKARREEENKNLNNIITSFNRQKNELDEAIRVIEKYEGLELIEPLKKFDSKYAPELDLDIMNITTSRITIISKIEELLNQLKDKIRQNSSVAETLMRNFKYPGRDISDKFPDWDADTHTLRIQAEFIDEYLSLLERIETQELANYKQQFKKYLNEEMITKMSDFQTWLEREEEDIEESIETLNKSLEQINFKNNPPTFIRLQVEKDYAPKVREFKIRLNEWKPNIAEFERTRDDLILEESFNKIRLLLDNLTADENHRKEVLDVRNWLKFKAVEHHREDRTKIFRSYTGTAKLSGGEGAQLTYTILGSAIAYQFGIHSEGLNTNSFRFICVDEAFSKQDDEKAKFLMELCKQLHLQLMVVSPAKAEEVAIVEPYIARVHFVQRKNNKNSLVFDMPIKQLKEHRQQYLESAEVS